METISVSALEGSGLHKFLNKINNVNPAAINPFANSRATVEVKNLPQKLQDLYKLQYERFSLDDLLAVNMTITLSKEEKKAAVTRSQSKSPDRHSYRAGRITASNFKSACATSMNKLSLSLIKQICYPRKRIFKTADVKYGLDQEDTARKSYTQLMKK